MEASFIYAGEVMTQEDEDASDRPALYDYATFTVV